MTTLTLPRRRSRARWAEIRLKLAEYTGYAVRYSGLKWAWGQKAAVPGLAGAGLASWGAALVYLPAGVILGGVFLLAMDRQINLPRGRE